MTTPEQLKPFESEPEPEVRVSRPEKSAIKPAEVIPIPVEWQGPGLLKGEEREAALLRLNWLDKRIDVLREEEEILDAGFAAWGKEKVDIREKKPQSPSFLAHPIKRIQFERKKEEINKTWAADLAEAEETRSNVGTAYSQVRGELISLLAERDKLLPALFEGAKLKEFQELQERLGGQKAEKAQPFLKENAPREFKDFSGMPILTTGESERDGYKIGDRLRVKYGMMVREELRRAQKLEIVGFTRITKQNEVVIQVDGERVVCEWPDSVSFYFEKIESSEGKEKIDIKVGDRFRIKSVGERISFEKFGEGTVGEIENVTKDGKTVSIYVPQSRTRQHHYWMSLGMLKANFEKVESAEEGEFVEYDYKELLHTFHMQVLRLQELGYAKAAHMKEEEFADQVFSLLDRVAELGVIKFKKDHIPFVIVVGEKLVPLKKQISLMKVDGKKGFVDPSELETLKTIEEDIAIPKSMAYLAVDVENGEITLDKTPYEAISRFKREGRSPLTAQEGIAVILQHPEILKDHEMALAGSRYGENVANLLLDEGKPMLELRWSGGKTPMRGSASCGSRVGP